MDLKIKGKIHNRFNIEVRDKDTNALKQCGFAENMVMDRAYIDICQLRYTFFSRIHFGTGTGEITAARTALFTPLGYKTAVDEEKIKAYPVSKLTRSIVLSPEEHVGETITEVGIGSNNTTVYIDTHALIKDAEGNQMSILKTELDVVTIYATVFVEFNTTGVVWAPPAENLLLKYFMDGVAGKTLYKLICDSSPLDELYTPSEIALLPSVFSFSSASKNFSVSARFGVDLANEPIRAVGVENLLKVVFPATGVFTGHHWQDRQIAVCDGGHARYGIPDIHVTNLHVKIDGVIDSNYVVSYGPYAEYIMPRFQHSPTGNSVSDLIISDDGLVCCHAHNTYYLLLKKFNAETNRYEDFGERLGSMDSKATVFGLSGDGTVLAILRVDEVMSVYKIQPDGSLHLIDEYADPRFLLVKPKLSYYGDVIICLVDTYSSDSIVFMYNADTSSYEKTQEIPQGAFSQKALSSDGLTFAVASPSQINVYKKAPEDPSYALFCSIPRYEAETFYYLHISSDGGTILATTTYKAVIYKINGVSYDMAQAITFGNASLHNIILSLAPDASYFLCNADGIPTRALFALNPETGLYEHINDHKGLPNYPHRASNGNFLLMSAEAYTYAYVYKVSQVKPYITFNTPPAAGAVITASYDVDNIPKTSDYVLDVSFTFQFGEGA